MTKRATDIENELFINAGLAFRDLASSFVETLSPVVQDMKPVIKALYRALVRTQSTLTPRHGALAHTNRVRSPRPLR